MKVTEDALKAMRVGLFVWGDLIEDFLDSLGLSLEQYALEGSGGWLFGYVEALKLAGIAPVVFCVSARVSAPTYLRNQKAEVDFCFLPAAGLYRRIRRRLLNPYAWHLSAAFDEIHWYERPFLAFTKAIAPYLATPLRTFVSELKAQGCSAVICQEYENPRFDVCVLLGKLYGFTVFASFQGGDFQMSWLEALIRPLSIRNCAGLIIATSTEIDRVISRYDLPEEKIHQIFNPLDDRLWFSVNRMKARQKLQIPADACVVINHGRTELGRKGLDVLLNAWSILNREKENNKLYLLLVGTGSDAQAVSKLITNMGVSNVIRIDEFVVDRETTREYLSCADLYVLPSRHEGFPVAPLEAMACGLPVIASRAQGVPDIFAEGEASGGIIVPIGDPDALASAILEIASDPGRAEALGKAAIARVHEAFSLKSVGQQFAQIFGKSVA